jgi:signal transduction histidine kinase
MPHSRARFPKSDTQLMETEKFEKWQRLWQDHEMARGLYKAAHGQLTTRANVPLPGIFWFTTPYPLFVPETSKQQLTNGPAGLPDAKMSAGGSNSNTASNAVVAAIRIDRGAWDRNWLALETGGGDTNAWFICHRESEIASRLNRLLAEKQPVPDYLGVGVEIAGRKINTLNSDLRLWHYAGWNNPHSPGGGEKKEYAGETATNILASAAESQAGEEALRVNVYLTSPSTLYRRQGARTFWFGSLVAVSAAAALIGLLTAWQAFRQQRQLNEMKSNFVSSVSHELRAPIASVRLMAENLEGGKISEPQKQREYFGFIVQECRRLTSLIENVLDFSRIEQGRKQYEFEPTDIAALVQTTVKLMEPNAAEKGVALKLETSNAEHRTSNIEFKMDGRAIQQALVNLIDNAIKHSPKGETVTVGMEARNENVVSDEDEGRERGREKRDKSLNPQPSTLNLSVTDNGPGIPPEEHEKIFERFYRRGSELRRETQGVGIGLSIVKHIVEAHGGRVLIESRAGQGSRFTIELPLEK